MFELGFTLSLFLVPIIVYKVANTLGYTLNKLGFGIHNILINKLRNLF